MEEFCKCSLRQTPCKVLGALMRRACVFEVCVRHSRNDLFCASVLDGDERHGGARADLQSGRARHGARSQRALPRQNRSDPPPCAAFGKLQAALQNRAISPPRAGVLAAVLLVGWRRPFSGFSAKRDAFRDHLKDLSTGWSGWDSGIFAIWTISPTKSVLS